MADAVVVPGGAFGPAAGLLMYAGVVAERRGVTVRRHSWSQPPEPFEPEIESWVRNEIVSQSVAVLGRVVTAMNEFLDAIGWPD